MSIATSIEKLSETLTNCKTNLKEKGVEADNIKISDVDEKIAEIKSGGGSGKLHVSVNCGSADGISYFKFSFNDNETHNVEVTVDNNYKENVSTLYAVDLSGQIKVEGVKESSGRFTFSNITNQIPEPWEIYISERKSYDILSPDSTPPFVSYIIEQES